LEQPKLLESLASKLWTPAKVLTSEGNKACQQLSYSDDALTGSHRGVLKDLFVSCPSLFRSRRITAQRPGPWDAWIATWTQWPGSLQRLVELSRFAAGQ